MCSRSSSPTSCFSSRRHASPFCPFTSFKLLNLFSSLQSVNRFLSFSRSLLLLFSLLSVLDVLQKLNIHMGQSCCSVCSLTAKCSPLPMICCHPSGIGNGIPFSPLSRDGYEFTFFLFLSVSLTSCVSLSLSLSLSLVLRSDAANAVSIACCC